MIRPNGFTMLEVLIAILVLAIGLLGLAALQSVSLKNGQSAYYRSIASQLAYDMSDRMRGNMTAVYANNYNRSGITTDYSTAVAACATVAGCNAAELAQNDAYEWQQLVQTLLPGGEAIVCIDGDGNTDDGTSAASHGCTATVPGSMNERPLHAVKIWWNDDRSAANAGGTKKRFVYAFRL